MTAPEVKTLFTACDDQDKSRPGDVLFLYAPPAAVWPDWLGDIGGVCYQPFKTDHHFTDRVKAVSLPEKIQDGPYDLVLMLAPKNREERRALIRFALARLAKEGSLVVCAANDAGGKTLEKDLKDCPGLEGARFDVTIKHKCRAVRVSGHQQFEARDRAGPPGMILPETTGLWSYPGMYGWDKIDRGSELLAQTVPALYGTVADFGCGTGYLLLKALEKSNRIEGIYGLDNDARAVASTERNVQDHPAGVPCETIWADCTQALPMLPPVDRIITNPPFHTGKKADPDLGLDFITTARDYLKDQGQIYLVANTHLPYEARLRKLFRKTDTMTQKDGFKILWAQK